MAQVAFAWKFKVRQPTASVKLCVGRPLYLQLAEVFKVHKNVIPESAFLEIVEDTAGVTLQALMRSPFQWEVCVRQGVQLERKLEWLLYIFTVCVLLCAVQCTARHR